MYKGGNHIALTEQDKKLLEEYERITERNVISITIDEEKTSGITDSKFGGVPYWDMQKEYPKSDKGEMLMMLAQINLDELNRDGYNPDGKLPKTGMLQFFIDIYDNDGNKVNVGRHPEEILRFKLDKKVYKDDILCNPSKNSTTVHIFTGTWLEGVKPLKRKIVTALKTNIKTKKQAEIYRKIFMR